MFEEHLLQQSDVEHSLEYITTPQKRMYIVHPTIYMAVQSRGTGKSTVLQAIRSMRIALEDVPRSLNVFYGASYVGLQMRTMPGVISGWLRFGLVEGDDFVINERPPKDWPKPYGYERPLARANTITMRNGSTFLLGSGDREGLVNSLSVTGGIFVDEFRFIDYERMARDLFPAMRGNMAPWGGRNPHNLSMTFTSDRPFASEAQWYLQYAEKMNPEQIVKIAQLSSIYEQHKSAILALKLKLDNNTGNKSALRAEIQAVYELAKEVKKRLDFIRYRFKTRKGDWVEGSTYYDTASVFSNAHVLTLDYIKRNADKRIMPASIFRTSFLNIKPEEVEQKYYAAWQSRRHVITGRWDYAEVERLGFTAPSGELLVSARHLLDYSPSLPVDIELDFGDMVTCSVSQLVITPEGPTELYLATFEVIYPQTVVDVINKIDIFLAGHSFREAHLYVDPSGYYQMDKERIEVYAKRAQDKLLSLGWQVINEVPEGSQNALHSLKHTVVNDILSEKLPNMPVVRVIRDTNIPLINSIQMCEYELYTNQRGEKVLRKVKRSEKELKLHEKLGGATTDHSDHFDIHIMVKYAARISVRSNPWAYVS